MNAPASTRRSPWRYLLPLAILLLLGLGAGAWLLRQQSVAAATAAQAGSDRIVAVGRGAIERSIAASGSVAAHLEVEIKCRASGEVIDLPFDISDVVNQGDLLCQLDPTDEQLAVQSRQAAVAQSEARLAQARAARQEAELNLATTRTRTAANLSAAQAQERSAQARAQRQQQLHAQNLGSLEELQTLEAEAATAESARIAAEVAIAEIAQQEVALESRRQEVVLCEAELQAQRIALSTQEQQLGYTTVLAPIAGVVASLDVQKGSIVASGTNNVSGGTTIMTLMDLSRLFLLAAVDESDIGGVQVGQAARIQVDSYPRRSFTGKVVRIAVQGVNTASVVTFEVKVEVTDTDKHLLKPLMTGEVTLILERQEDVLLLPTEAVRHRAGKTLVELPDGQLREVQLGLQGIEQVQILAGLEEGQQVRVAQSEPESRWRRSGGGPPPMF